MLKSKTLFNTATATQFGVVAFDQNGESRDLNSEQEQYLAERIQGFEFIEVKPEVVKEAPEADVKEATPDEAKPVAKKRTTRKKADAPEE